MGRPLRVRAEGGAALLLYTTVKQIYDLRGLTWPLSVHAASVAWKYRFYQSTEHRTVLTRVAKTNMAVVPCGRGRRDGHTLQSMSRRTEDNSPP